jgi:sigma-B regulation protein RsbU (phosphoserine phosphatase)
VIVVGATTIVLEQPSAAETASDVGETLLRPASDLVHATLVERDPSDVEALRRQAARLRAMTEVHRSLDRSVELGELFEVILDQMCEQLRPESAVVVLRTAEGGLTRVATRSAGRDAGMVLESQHLCHEVMDKGMAALVLDIRQDARFQTAESLLATGVRSLIAAPLLDPDGSLGMIVLGSGSQPRQFSQDDLEMLASLASVAAMRIRNLRLTEAAAERRRLEQEVALAREVQMRLLPVRLPELDGWAVFGSNVPSRGVSGDFYTVRRRHEGDQCAVFLADVSGKGIGASLLTASLEALVAASLAADVAPEQLCADASSLLFERTPPEKFATAFVAVLELASGQVRYCNAGHTAAMLVRASGQIELLKSTGMPLGMLPQGAFRAGSVELRPDDLLVLYTDGFVEAANPNELEYGEERLAAVLRHSRALPLDAVATAIDEDVTRFVEGVPYADDRTLVLLRRVGSR